MPDSPTPLMQSQDAALPWVGMPHRVLPCPAPVGELWCADGDGMWSVLLVRPGQERDVAGDAVYGYGWEEQGISRTFPGAYIFNQGRLASFIAPDDGHPVDSQQFCWLALRLAENMMREMDPGLYDYLLPAVAGDERPAPGVR